MSDTTPFTAQDVRGLLPLLEKSISFANDMTGYYQSQFIGSNAERVSSDAEFEAAMAPVETAAAMLELFAQRLEQEEQQQTAFAATEGAAYAIVPHGAAEALREEGRREILKDVALVHPVRWDDRQQKACVYCGHGQIVPHTLDCLWWRAQQARQTPETP